MNMPSFEELFEELARHNDRSVIWNNWLEYTINANILYRQRPDNTNYHGNEKTYFEMMQAWLNELAIKLEKYPYYDMLGKFYEELVQSKSKAGQLQQYYSPISVTELLSDLDLHDKKADDLHGRIANDPTCGSARTLLSAHVKSKGELFCVGQDLDRTSCHMAVLNFYSHGVRGSILHMDTLELTFYAGWRINKYLYHGIPIPHIEEIHSPVEAYDFFELKNDNVDETTVAPTTISKGDVQTTLI